MAMFRRATVTVCTPLLVAIGGLGQAAIKQVQDGRGVYAKLGSK